VLLLGLGLLACHAYYLAAYRQNEHATFSAALLQGILTFPGICTIAMAIYCVVLLLSLVSLTGYHVYLVVVGETTHEQIRGYYEARGGSPWTKGCISNCARTCCPSWTPSFVFLGDVS